MATITDRKDEAMNTITPTAHIDITWENERPIYTVYAKWTGADIDRPLSHSTQLLNKRTAKRFADAIQAGVAFTDPQIVTDANGKTYVAAKCHVFGKYANANLKALGF
jgi:hypothetical protein